MRSISRAWNRSSRRHFFGGYLTAVVASASSIMRLNSFSYGQSFAQLSNKQSKDSQNNVSAAMAGQSYDTCRDICYYDYDLGCCEPCRRLKGYKARLCYAACATALAACYAACEANRVNQLIVDTAEWLTNHPEVVLGTVVIIGGVTFIVVSGGSGLILAPVFAL